MTKARQQTRFEEFAARFTEKAKAGPGESAAARLGEDYWASVQELFTRDVTEEELRRLVIAEPQDTYRFFTREVDLSSLAHRPWYERYPLAAWKVFLAMAYRLSPPRRILFAVAVPVLAVAWLGYLTLVLMEILRGQWLLHALPSWMLLASSLLFVLLVLELRDKLVLKGDLEVARQIQFGLLPFEPFEQGGTSVHAVMRPANTVGGDYFDLIELPEGRLAVTIGDVAGKGMPAALLMALLQGSLRTLLSAGFRGADLMAKLNGHLFTNIPSNRLITLFYGEYEPASGRLAYVNAGHNPPLLLRRDGSADELPATGMALGVVADAAYEAPVVTVETRERLFLYTDGITEAFDPRDNEYGEDRLRAFLARSAGLGHRELIEAVRADVLAFCGTASPRDDMTLLVLARDAAR